MGTLLKVLFGLGVFFLIAEPSLGVALLFVWGVLLIGSLPFRIMKDAERR